MYTESKRKKIKLYLTIALAAAPFLTAASVFVNVNFIDQNTGFSIDNSIVPMILNLLIAAAAVALFVLSFGYKIVYGAKDAENEAKISEAETTEEQSDHSFDEFTVYEEAEKDAEPKEERRDKHKNDPVTEGARLVLINRNSGVIFTTALLGFMFIATFLLVTIRNFEAIAVDAVSYVILLLSAVCGIHFIFSSAKNMYPHTASRSFISSIPVFWGAARLIQAFIAQHNNVNLEMSFFTLMTSISIMFFFYYEALFTLKNEKMYNLRMYILSGLYVIIFVALKSVPGIILSSFWLADFTNDTFFSLLETAVGIYAAAKLINLYRTMGKAGE